jgi:hypothetical protein
MTGARLNPAAPEGTAGATSEVANKKLAKPVLVSRGQQKILRPNDCGRSGRAGQLPQRRDHFGTMVGFPQEYAPGRQIVVFYLHKT